MKPVACIALAFLIAQSAWAALELARPIPPGSDVQVTGHGAPPGAYVELLANDEIAGCVQAGDDGRFSFLLDRADGGTWLHARCALVWDFSTPQRVAGWDVANAVMQLDGEVLTLRATGGAISVTTAADYALDLDGTVHRVLELAARNQSSAKEMIIAWSFDGVSFDGPGQQARLALEGTDKALTTCLLPLDHLEPIAGAPDTSTWDSGERIARLRFTWDGMAAGETITLGRLRIREDIALDFDSGADARGLRFSGLDSLGVMGGALHLRPTGPDPYLVLDAHVNGYVDPDHYTVLELGGFWETGVPESVVQAYWADNDTGDGPDGYANNGNFSETLFSLTADSDAYQRVPLPVDAYPKATWRKEEGPVRLSGLRIDPMVYPSAAFISPDDRIRIDHIRVRNAAAHGPSPTVVVGAPADASAPHGTRPDSGHIPSNREPLSFTVDMAGQPGDHQVLRQIDTVATMRGWRGGELTEKDWGLRRWEGVIIEMAGWMRLSSHDPQNSLHTVDAEGRYVFKPMPGTKETIDKHVLNGGLRPNIAMGTPTMPWPLVEGGFKSGQYGYQIRQPRDYEAWKYYLETMFQWLIDQYGRDEVKTWTYLFGIESDWQAKAVYPGTQVDMGEEENRREFMRELDYFHAAAVEKLGATVYVGCYFAFETQADDYVRHWAAETNYATGEVGTRIGWCGFSDWYIVNMDHKNPYSRSGQARRRGNVGNTWAAGLIWKYEHVAGLLDKYPALRAVEIGLPECGYFDAAGAVNPRTGDANPADVAFADHRGATLRSLRNIAYAECPRLAFAKNHYALGTGAGGLWVRDRAKAPVFNAVRIQRDMAGDRPLRVEKLGREERESNDVRLLATATDAPGIRHRVLLTNFNERFTATGVESATVRLGNLPKVDVLSITEYRVDETHNNWWKAWKAYREAEGIPYVAGANHTHLGANVRYADKYIPWHNDVIGTLRPEDVPQWLAWAEAHEDAMRFEPTGGPVQVPVEDGRVVLRYDMPVHGTLLLEISYADTEDTLPKRLLTGPRGWDQVRRAIYADSAGRGGAPALTLLPGQGEAGATRRITGLAPNTVYVARAWSKASGRIMDYGLVLEGADGPVTGWGDRSARWNRLAAVARSNANGELVLCLTVPKQPCDSDDTVTFSNVELRPVQ